MASCHYLMCTESVNYETIWKIFRTILANDTIPLEMAHNLYNICIVKIKCVCKPYLIVFFCKSNHNLSIYLLFFLHLRKGCFSFRARQPVQIHSGWPRRPIFLNVFVIILNHTFNHLRVLNLNIDIQCVANEFILFIISNIWRLTPVSIKVYL